MTAETQVTPRDVRAQALAKLHMLKPAALSIAVAVPAMLLTVFLMESKLVWPEPQLFVIGVLGVMAVNFGLLVLVEPYRGSLGPLTLPAMLGFIAMVILFVMTDCFNRFITECGFGWLTPFTLVGLSLLYAAVFREKHMPLKLVLAINGLSLTALWCLGTVDRVALPF
jgi:hypothetical protein